MGEELKKELDVEVELVASAGGIFAVSIDNREIFSKDRAGRFPAEGEIVSLIKVM